MGITSRCFKTVALFFALTCASRLTLAPGRCTEHAVHAQHLVAPIHHEHRFTTIIIAGAARNGKPFEPLKVRAAHRTRRAIALAAPIVNYRRQLSDLISTISLAITIFCAKTSSRAWSSSTLPMCSRKKAPGPTGERPLERNQ